MGMLFISHASADEALALRMQQALAARGVTSVFLDVDPALGIVAGQAWQSVLYRRLRSCHALVALVTDAFLSSRWCFAEVALARMQGKQLFGVKADPLAADAALPELLSDRQQVDARLGFEAAVDRLLVGLERAGLRGLGAQAWDRRRSPFPGLLAFDEADAGVFFGRDDEQQRAFEAVQGAVRGTAARWVLLLGASGSGKSSLMRAGLMPRLRQQPGLVLLGPLRPRGRPMEELAFHLSSGLGLDESALTQALIEAVREPLAQAPLDRIVSRALRRQGESAHALLLIDQFEELLGRPQGHEAHAVLRLLRGGTEPPEGRLTVVATLRSDQLGVWQAHEQAQGLEWQSVSVAPMGSLQLRRVIEEPARLAERELEPGLVDRLVTDTASAQALPLLAMTLQRLWQRHGDEGRWQIAHYEALGGVQAAIAREAEAALGAAPTPDLLALVRVALLELVRLDEQGRASRQARDWGDLPDAAHPLLENFVRRRLLVRDGPAVEVAHEGLFTAWQRLADWIAQDREALLLRQQLAQAAAGWQASQDESELWRGARLDRALELLPREAVEGPIADASAALATGSADFLRASVAARERHRQEQAQAQQERERLARIALGRGLAYQALGEAKDRPQRGLLLAVAAAEATREIGLAATDAAENALRELLSQTGGRNLGRVGRRILCLSVSPDGSRVAAGADDGQILVAQLLAPEPDEGPPPVRWQAHGGAVRMLGWQGDTLISQGDDSGVQAWRFNSGQGARQAAELRAPGPRILACAIGEATGRVALAVEGSGLQLQDRLGGAWVPLCDASLETRVLAYSSDERWLAQGLSDGRLMLWSLDPHQPVVTGYSVAAHDGAVTRVTWAREASCFVTAGEDRSLYHWRFDGSPAEIAQQALRGAGSPVQAVAVSDDGRLVVAGLWEPRALVWTAGDGFAEPAVLQGHPSTVDNVALASGGQWILTASSRDNSLCLWPAAQLRQEPEPIRLRGEDRWISALLVAPQGFILAGSYAGTVRRWHRVVEEPWSMDIPGVDLNRVALSADGAHLLAAGAAIGFGREPDRRAKAVDLLAERIDLIDEPPAVVAVAITADAALRVLGSGDGRLHLLDRRHATQQVLDFPIDGWFGHLALDPGGRWLVASGSAEASLGPSLFDLRAGVRLQELAPAGSVLQAAVFDPSGERLLTITDSQDLRLWRRDGEGFVLVSAQRHEGARWCAFCPLSERWFSGGADGLRVWAMGVDAVLHPLSWAESVDAPNFALASQADVVAAYGGQRARIWRLDEPGTRIDLPLHEGHLQRLALSPDGQQAATAMVDGGVRLWSLRQPGSPLPFPGSRSGSLLLHFGEDGHSLLVGDSNQSLTRWDLDLVHLIERARRVAGRELDDEERARFLGA